MESRLSADHLATSDGPAMEISILSFLSWPWRPVDGISSPGHLHPHPIGPVVLDTTLGKALVALHSGPLSLLTILGQTPRLGH